MASGDVVSGFLPAGAWTNFQPAAGVEVVITFLGGRNDDFEVGIYNGATIGVTNVNSKTGTVSQCLFKLGINNTNYLRAKSASDNGSFSGIQTK